MTTKTVAVQLVAMTSQYQASMAKATASTAKLQTTSAAAGKGIGRVMGPQLAVAGAVVAGVATKLAYDWDKAFTRIAAVTDTSQAQVGKWKEEVLALAGTTARAPQELAEALYFLASAGLDANEVMPTLEMSAKAAAVGLGETGDIARLTANAINAYSSSGLTAAQVTDTLVAAVREGTAEPTEFADAMGRILPIASKAGVSFDQVAASLSGLSNIGLDVNEGVTAMRGVLMALEAPGSQAAEALDSIGLSADDVRRALSEDGLIATLRMLETQSGGNIDVLRKIVPNVRALTGVFGLTTQEAKKVDEIFHDVQHSAGSLGEALDKTKESSGHQLRQAFSDLQAAGIKLGGVLLPIFAKMATNAAIMAGAVIDALEAIGKAFDVGNVDAILGDLKTAFDSGKISTEQYAEALRGLADNGLISLDQFESLTGAAVKTADTMAKVQANVDAASGSMAQGSSEADRYGGKIGDVGGAAGDAKGEVGKLGGVVQDAAADLADAEKAADGFAAALDALTKVAFDVEDARLNWHQGLIDLRKELRAGAKTLDLNSQAGLDNREAMKGQLENAIAVGIAMREKGLSEKAATKITAEHVRQVRDEAIAAGFAAGEVDAYIRTLNLTPKQISTLIKAVTAPARAAVRGFIGDLNKIPDIKDVLIRVRSTGLGTGQQIGHSGGVVGNLPRYHGGGDVKSDEQLVLARKGETIRTVAQERALMSSRRAGGAGGLTKVIVVNRITPKLDRRRFTEELDQDATYTGRWG